MSEHGSNRAVGSELLGYIERVERLEKQKKEIGEDIAAVYAEAKLDGYEPKAMKSIVKDRKAKPHDLEEAKTLKDLYESALGMKRDLPLFRHFANLGDAVTDDALIKALEPTVPPGGEIILKTGERPLRLWRTIEGDFHTEDYVPPEPRKPSSRVQQAPPPSSEPVPDVDAEGAEELGRRAYIANQPITSNPFPWDDPRRPRFDAGWRAESGSDGIGDD